jgi:exopolysaccharide biosynthesis polyprenyl glycosylphosphotransferase
MFSNQHRKAKLLFGLSDILLLGLAFEAAYRSRLSLPNLRHIFYFTTEKKALVLGLALLSWVLAGYWLNVYQNLGTGRRTVIFGDLLRQTGYASIALVFSEYLLRLDLSRPFLAFFTVFAFALILIFRFASRRLVGLIRREFGALRYVLVVGTGDRARRLALNLEAAADQGIRLKGFLSIDGAGEQIAPVRLASASYPVYPIWELSNLLRQEVIDEVVFAVDSHALRSLEEVFLQCDEEGVRTRVAVDFFPHVNSEMYLERLGPIPLLTFSATPDDEVHLFLKRTIDVVIAAIALALLSPLFLVIAILVRLTSPGPSIFCQERCGLNGRRFTFYKFRSMVQDAEARRAEVLHMSTRSTATKIPNDPRLTIIGSFLRRFSLDELPQLFNVLKGDMSLVGPRPAIPEEVAQYEVWQRRRLRMRPGLTCIWALNGRDHVDFETWMKMDMQYIDNWSLGLDWKIIFRTIPQVVLGKGAN